MHPSLTRLHFEAKQPLTHKANNATPAIMIITRVVSNISYTLVSQIKYASYEK